MKHLNQFITEYIVKKKLDKAIDSEDHYDYFPESKEELTENIEQLINKGIYDLNHINTSKITDMSNLFKYINLYNVNFDVSKWDVSNVTNMNYMFNGCIKFDCDLSNWDVSNVLFMASMFDKCQNFTGKGLENWDVSKVRNTQYMFNDCKEFNCDLSKWNTRSIIHMHYMFYNCKKFDCDLSNWDVSNVENMMSTFFGCTKFTGKGLENWDVSNVTDMNVMFEYCFNLKNKPSWYKY